MAPPAAAPVLPPSLPPTAGESERELSPEEKAAEKAEKNKRVRRQISREIMTTEMTYVEGLAALVEVAMEYMRVNEVLTDVETQTLFSQAATIYTCNKNFCAELQARVEAYTDDTQLADLFVKFAPYFRMYNSYAANHEHATEFMHKFKQQSRYDLALAAIKENPRFKAPDLSTYLIMPIQRIPRYRLLLAELIKLTPPGHPDFAATEKALELISAVAASVNEAIKGQQNRHTILRIAANFTSDPEVVAPSRCFIRQGELTKRCRASDITYEFFLFNDLLVYASRTATGKFKLHRKIPINNMFLVTSLEDEPRACNRFQIVNSIKSFEVCAADKDTKDSWMTALSECIGEQTKKISAATATTGILAPVWQGDSTSNACQVCRIEFTLFNRRHHCRRCGGLVCDKCSRHRMCLPGSTKKERICDTCVAAASGGSAAAPTANAAASAPAVAATTAASPATGAASPASAGTGVSAVPVVPSRPAAPARPAALSTGGPAGAGTVGGPMTPSAAAVAARAAQMAAARAAAAAAIANGVASPANSAAAGASPRPAPALPAFPPRTPSAAVASSAAAAAAAATDDDSTDSEEEEEVAEALRNQAEIAAYQTAHGGSARKPSVAAAGTLTGASAVAAASAAAAAAAASAAAAAASAARSSAVADPATGEVPTEGGLTLRPYMVSRAQYAYVSAQPGDLNFGEGAEIHVYYQDNSGWWTGKLAGGGDPGIFPSTYVVLDEDANAGYTPYPWLFSAVCVEGLEASPELPSAMPYRRGDNICVSSASDDWYFGYNLRDGAEGWVRASHLGRVASQDFAATVSAQSAAAATSAATSTAATSAGPTAADAAAAAPAAAAAAESARAPVAVAASTQPRPSVSLAPLVPTSPTAGADPTPTASSSSSAAAGAGAPAGAPVTGAPAAGEDAPGPLQSFSAGGAAVAGTRGGSFVPITPSAVHSPAFDPASLPGYAATTAFPASAGPPAFPLPAQPTGSAANTRVGAPATTPAVPAAAAAEASAPSAAVAAAAESAPESVASPSAMPPPVSPPMPIVPEPPATAAAAAPASAVAAAATPTSPPAPPAFVLPAVATAVAPAPAPAAAAVPPPVPALAAARSVAPAAAMAPASAAGTAAAVGGALGGCSECGCKAFNPNVFKRTVCKDCTHNIGSHQH
jgi:hypothetical protein